MTTIWSLPEVANPWPVDSAMAVPWAPLMVGDFAEELAVILIDDHDAVLAGDEDAVVGRVGDDVIPGTVAADGVGVGDVVARRLGEKHAGGGKSDSKDSARGHGEPPQTSYPQRERSGTADGRASSQYGDRMVNFR